MSTYYAAVYLWMVVIYFYLKETHVIHMFKEDFYGSTLKVIMLGYIRPMRNFSSLGKLCNTFKEDFYGSFFFFFITLVVI